MNIPLLDAPPPDLVTVSPSPASLPTDLTPPIPPAHIPSTPSPSIPATVPSTPANTPVPFLSILKSLYAEFKNVLSAKDQLKPYLDNIKSMFINPSYFLHISLTYFAFVHNFSLIFFLSSFHLFSFLCFHSLLLTSPHLTYIYVIQ